MAGRQLDSGGVDLPLFPLHLVLFPGRPLPLHLFEPRYRQMLQDCLADGGRFGVVAIRAGREVGTNWAVRSDGVEPEAVSVIHAVGTLTEIKTVAERADGRFDIITRGFRRFRILRAHHDRPYLHAEVEVLEDPEATDADREAARALRQVLIPYLTDLGVPGEFCSQLPDEPVALSYAAASSLQVELPVQQHLLEVGSCADRAREVIRIIRRESELSRHLGTVGSFRPPGPGGAQLN